MPANLHLTLAIPGLLWPHQQQSMPVIHLPALDKLRHWGKFRPFAISRNEFYQHYLWQGSWLKQAKKQLNLNEKGHTILAIPTSQIAGLHQIQCLSGKALALTQIEAKNFCQVLNNWQEAEGWRFWPVQPDLWLLTTPTKLQFNSPALLDLDGYIDGTTKPTGRDAMQILKYQTELQMLLHQHPLNHERGKRGLPPINAIWFETDHIGKANPSIPTFTNSTWAYCAQQFPADYDTLAAQLNDQSHFVLFNDELLQPSNQGDRFTYEQILQQWEQRWWQPLLTALHIRQIRQLDITTDGAHGGLLHIRKPRITPFWRKACSFNGLML